MPPRDGWRGIVAAGADLVLFSAQKPLGGPTAGIVAGAAGPRLLRPAARHRPADEGRQGGRALAGSGAAPPRRGGRRAARRRTRRRHGVGCGGSGVDGGAGTVEEGTPATGSVYATIENVLAGYADPHVAATTDPVHTQIDVAEWLSGNHTIFVVALGHEQARLRPVLTVLLQHAHRVPGRNTPTPPSRPTPAAPSRRP